MTSEVTFDLKFELTGFNDSCSPSLFGLKVLLGQIASIGLLVKVAVIVTFKYNSLAGWCQRHVFLQKNFSLIRVHDLKTPMDKCLALLDPKLMFALPKQVWSD